MKDIILLAQKHKIEDSLFHGDGLERIYKLIGDGRMTWWLSSIWDEELSRKQTWEKLVKFLEKEQKLQQQKMLIQGIKTEPETLSDKGGTSRYKHSYYTKV